MLIHSSSQLLTLAGGPQRGRTLGTLGIIQDGAVVVRDEKIVAVARRWNCVQLPQAKWIGEERLQVPNLLQFPSQAS